MKKSFKNISIICLAVLSLILFISSPFFKITNVTVSGQTIVSSEYIKNILKYEDTNIFSANSKNALAKLSDNTYIKDLELKKDFPNSIEINIVERIPSGYIKYSEDTYLYIDSEGVVLEVVSSFKDRLPIVTGLDFKNFAVGQPLQIDDSSAFSALLILSRLINKYDMAEDMTIMNLSDLDDIHLLVNNVDIVFGDISDADQKIQKTKAVIVQLPDYKKIKATVNLKSNTVSIDT